MLHGSLNIGEWLPPPPSARQAWAAQRSHAYHPSAAPPAQVDMHVDAAHVALQAKLGAGGFGSVWQGWWRGRMVAVKVMHRNLFEQPYGPDLLSSFQQEVELLSRYAAPGEGSTRKNHPG